MAEERVVAVRDIVDGGERVPRDSVAAGSIVRVASVAEEGAKVDSGRDQVGTVSMLGPVAVVG